MDFIPDRHLRNDPRGAAAQVAAHILLDRQVNPDTAWLVVEGVADDRLFDRFVDLQRTRLACACGRRAVLEVSDQLSRYSKRDGFVGVVDLDFDALRGSPPVLAPVFVTDSHDIETMCLASDHALNAVLSEYCDRERRREFESTTGKSIRQTVLEAAREIGLIRLASLELRLGLKVAGWDYRSHYPQFLDDLKVDRERLYAFLESTPTLRYDGSNRTCTADQISELRAAVSRLDGLYAASDTLLIACGHDACKVLAASIGPSRILGGPNHVEPRRIEQGLRLAYPEHVFLNTKLFNSLKAWQEDNQAWTLLQS